MNVTAYVSEFIASTPPSAVPGIIINRYSKYLWNYEPDSWVAKVAYSARVVAILVSLPVMVLGLLDITSYGIARTLGIVDDVRASTSDETAKTATPEIPTIHVVVGESTSASESPYTDSDHESTDQIMLHSQYEATSSLLSASHPEVFYASGDNGLKLAGADIFSPATSRPPSPTISSEITYSDGSETKGDNRDNLGVGLRHRLTVEKTM